MAKRKRRRSTRAKKQDFPGWLWMLFGLAIGLSVALAVYMRVGRPYDTAVADTQELESRATALDRNSADATTSAVKEEPKKSRFTFYDVLPNFVVEIPDQAPDVSADVEPRAVVEPGLYVLQAGSFSTDRDADRRRAELALHGIESHIQRVKINDRAYYRVYVGPTDDLEELNMLRSRLRVAKIDVLRIRLGD